MTLNPKFEVLTLFPKFFESPLKESILGRAIKKGLIQVNLTNIRDFAKDSQSSVDDKPYGGGEGMVLRVDILAESLKAVKNDKSAHVILLDPKGKQFNQKTAEKLSTKKNIVLVCGHYEGVDQRFADHYVDETLSIGDYVLSGGEPAALVIIDSVARLVEGSLGNKDSAKHESFSIDKNQRIFDYPVYTRPEVYERRSVPKVLLSGDHKKINNWRKVKALELTKKARPDLL